MVFEMSGDDRRAIANFVVQQNKDYPVFNRSSKNTKDTGLIVDYLETLLNSEKPTLQERMDDYLKYHFLRDYMINHHNYPNIKTLEENYPYKEDDGTISVAAKNAVKLQYETELKEISKRVIRDNLEAFKRHIKYQVQTYDPDIERDIKLAIEALKLDPKKQENINRVETALSQVETKTNQLLKHFNLSEDGLEIRQSFFDDLSTRRTGHSPAKNFLESMGIANLRLTNEQATIRMYLEGVRGIDKSDVKRTIENGLNYLLPQKKASTHTPGQVTEDHEPAGPADEDEGKSILQALTDKILKNSPMVLASNAGRLVIKNALDKKTPNPKPGDIKDLLNDQNLLLQAQQASLREISLLMAVNAGNIVSKDKTTQENVAKEFAVLAQENKLLKQEDIKRVISGEKAVTVLSDLQEVPPPLPPRAPKANISSEEVKPTELQGKRKSTNPFSPNFTHKNQKSEVNVIAIDFDGNLQPELNVDGVMMRFAPNNLRRLDDAHLDAIKIVLKNPNLVQADVTLQEHPDQSLYLSYGGRDVTAQIEEALYSTVKNSNNLRTTEAEFIRLCQDPNNFVVISSKGRFPAAMENFIKRLEEREPNIKGKVHIIGAREATQCLINQEGINIIGDPEGYQKERVHAPIAVVLAEQCSYQPTSYVLVDDSNRGNVELRVTGSYIQTKNDQGFNSKFFNAGYITTVASNAGKKGLEVANRSTNNVNIDTVRNIAENTKQHSKEDEIDTTDLPLEKMLSRHSKTSLDEEHAPPQPTTAKPKPLPRKLPVNSSPVVNEAAPVTQLQAPVLSEQQRAAQKAREEARKNNPDPHGR